jgi:hypothetical protein
VAVASGSLLRSLAVGSNCTLQRVHVNSLMAASTLSHSYTLCVDWQRGHAGMARGMMGLPDLNFITHFSFHEFP